MCQLMNVKKPLAITTLIWIETEMALEVALHDWKKQLTGAWILSNLAPVWKITGIEPHNEIWTFIPFLNSEFLFIIDSN